MRISPSDVQLTIPESSTSVLLGHQRWHWWVEMFETGDQTFLPFLEPEQRASLLVVARYLRALCRPGSDGIDPAEWPFFWVVLMDGFPPCERPRRGEVHLQRVANWLRNRYLVSHTCYGISHFNLICGPRRTSLNRSDEADMVVMATTRRYT